MVVGEIATGTDVVVIGGGPGGYAAAFRAAQLGKDVTLIEKADLGGVCLNVGCIPSKALISAASAYHRLLHLEAERGILADNVRVDVKKMQAWKQRVVKKLTGGIETLCKGNGVNVVRGTATFTAPDHVLVETANGSESYKFEHAIIATGSRPVELEALPFDGEVVLNSTQALALEEVPARLAVVGGGYIGLELGTVFAKLGSKVTVIEATPQLLPGTDPELVRVLARSLKKLGVDVHLQTLAQKVERTDQGARLHLASSRDGQETTLDVDRVLVTVGRRPNSEGLGLERIGVNVDERGFIQVDEQRRTSVRNLFAIGDVAGEPMLAHKATHEGLTAAAVIAGEPAAFEPATIPAVIFTDPEIAYAGLTEQAAKDAGYDVITGRFPFQASGRALTTGDDQGFVKVVAERETHVILGVQIAGPQASDLISEATLAIEMAARLEDVALTIHPHPTLPEAFMEAAEAALGRTIHTLLPR